MYPLVYIVRHGQTAWNAEFRLQGQADTDLNALGREQATGNGRRLADLVGDPGEFDFVASPMRRTRETMERIRAAMKLDPLAYRTDIRLIEVNFGDWQSFTFAELETRSRIAMLQGFPGYEQEFQVVIGNRVLWMHEQVSVRKIAEREWQLDGTVIDITARRLAEGQKRGGEA